VPVFAVALLEHDGKHTGWRVAACVIFGIASITDRIDGDLARRRNLVTEFGKMVDPIADKALIGTALVGLSVLDILPWWVTLLVVGREIFITLLRLWVIRRSVIPASRGGKIKTFVQAVAIGLYLLPLPHSVILLPEVVMAAAVLLTMGTGIDYVVRIVGLRRRTALG
jgi:CDP-diacylglycerol--glycerol-3-phosphate 3-phosphatidyltransferase